RAFRPRRDQYDREGPDWITRADRECAPQRKGGRMRFWLGLGKGFGALVGVRRLAGLSPIVGLLLLPLSLLVLAFLSYFLWLNFKIGWELSDGRGWKTFDVVPQAVANGITVAPN